MAYTKEQLEAMGAKPVVPQATTPQAPKKAYTAQELQSMGATPVSLKVPEQPKQSLMQKAGGVLDAVFGAGKVGELIGTQIAKRSEAGRELAAQEASGVAPKGSVSETFKNPSFGQVAGSVGQAALNFAPVGTIAKGVTGTARALGVGNKISKGIGAIGAGAGTGYGFDVATGMAQGEENPLAPGAGTAIGTAIPLVPPVLRGAGRAVGEGLGVSTGVGFGPIKSALQATSKGGEEAQAFRDAMRGNVSPDQIVDEARGALGTIISDRTKAYRSQLEKLKTNTKEFDVNPVIQKFNKQLEDFGVAFDDAGLPDFSRSPGLQRYEKDLYNMSMVLKNWGTKAGDNTVVGIDKLKQVIDDFRIGSRDSQKFDTFVTALRNEAKGLIKNEPGYEKLVKDYESSTGLIKEIQRGLSLGDRAQADTAFRKLTTTLRTNNEFRKQLIDELNEVTGGTLVPKVAGQQMSEFLPRGLSRIATGALGAGGLVTGVGIIPILKAALFTSPRLVGEVLNALGFTASKIKQVLEVIAPKGLQFPGDELYDRVMGKNTAKLGSTVKTPLSQQAKVKSVSSFNSTKDRFGNNKQGGYIKNPFVREEVKSYVPSNVRSGGVRNMQVEAKDALKNNPTGNQSARELLLDYLNGSNSYTKTELATAIDILGGKAKQKGIGPIDALKEDPLIKEARKYKSAEEFVRAKTKEVPTEPMTKTGKPVTIKSYHGTKKQFDNFEIQKDGVRYTGDGIYFTPSKEGAKNFGDRVIEAHLELKNPYNLYLPKGNFDWQPGADRINEIKRAGHDAIIVRFKDVDDITGKVEGDYINEIVVFDTKAIQKSDPTISTPFSSDGNKALTKSQLTDIWKKANNQ